MHCLGAGVSAQAGGTGSSPANPSGSGSSGSAGSSSGGSNATPVSTGSNIAGTSSSTSSTSSSSSTGSNSSSSSSGNAEVGGESVVLGVVRALGVLVCEGRIQGPPRGYKEGPHCVAPLTPQSVTNHQCEKDNCLCDRYLVLVREIKERVEVGSYLCVEVVLCSDCPCGLLKSKCKKRVVSNVLPTTPWQHTSEMLLEYWCIGIVQSKNPETMMNSQGLYQAVRSRLHFSQVAAWWSRTQGARPSYIATRLVPSNNLTSDEHLKRFSETPIEHNFPLANLGDGHFVQVTMWALPRMEDIPYLQCQLHHHQQQEEPKTIVDGCPRASTPSKHVIPSSNNDNTAGPTIIPDLVAFDGPASNHQIPALLDDRLRIDCDQYGKHHCQCADDEEDVHEIPTSPAAAAAAAALVRPNGERKRRRSLPCRPPEPTTSAAPASGSNSPVLPKLQESVPSPSGDRSALGSGATLESVGSLDGLERSFRTQLSIEDQQECGGNQEKRYKRSESSQQRQQPPQDPENNPNVPLLIPWLSYSANGHAQASSLPVNNDSSTKANVNLVINPFHSYENFTEVGKKMRGRSAEPELTNSGPQRQRRQGGEGRNKVNFKAGSIIHGEDLNRLMSKLSFTQDKESRPGSSKLDQSKLLELIYSVPGCVLGQDELANINNNNNNELVDVKGFTTNVAQISGDSTTSSHLECDVKARNRHLKLSPKEFDEVIAVLKARTPMGRKRPGLRTVKRKERYDRLVNEVVQVQNVQTSDEKSLHTDVRKTEESLRCNKADMFMGAILRSSSKESSVDRIGLADISNGTRTSAVKARENAKAFDTSAGPKMTIPYVAHSSDRDNKSKVLVSDNDDSSLPSVINKRILRIKQIFKRDQDKTTLTEDSSKHAHRSLAKHESRAKRRIDFSPIDLEDCIEVSRDNEINETCCSSSAGTSQNSAHVYQMLLGNKNCETKSGCSTTVSGYEKERNTNYFEETSKRKNKQRGKRDLSPICVDHKVRNDDKVGRNEISCVGSELDNGDKTIVPSAKDQERFRRSLENAASMVFHSRTGLPLTSSPAPLRRGHCCFDFDSSLNSVSSKRSALFELNTPPSPGAVSLEETDREIENVCDIEEATRRRSNSRNRPQSHSLLGSFEESALNGRLEPVSTVHGFTAEIGASGAFCPKHRKLPVTVFFYTLGDNDKVSSPYLAHINLGKKGYQVPRSGTIQVTLLNPLGTVVKMFVVLYDLTDMPVKSHTFLRQRTLRDKTLRYLIHLRFMSGKSGRIYLHTDVRMIICRKADVDTASDFGSEPPKELRSYIHGPTNPKFSPRC